MKYVSELNGKIYDTVEALKKAEDQISEEEKKKEQQKKQRQIDAKEIEELFKDIDEKKKLIKKKISEFNEKYKSSYKTTITNVDSLFYDPFDDLFNKLFLL